MTDFERMGAQFEINDNGDEAVIKGAGPVATVGNYQAEVNAYTRGKGVLRLKMSGYRPCHNTDEVIEQIGYEAERDTRNPADSVFCAHGSGLMCLGMKSKIMHTLTACLIQWELMKM